MDEKAKWPKIFFSERDVDMLVDAYVAKHVKVAREHGSSEALIKMSAPFLTKAYKEGIVCGLKAAKLFREEFFEEEVGKQ